MRWIIEIPEATPTLNTVLRMTWANRRRDKARWLTWLSVRTVGIPKAESKRTITIERFGHALLDMDNLIGGCKEVVIDNLKQPGIKALKDGSYRVTSGTGMIMDDEIKSLHAVYIQHKIPRKDKPRTVVTIEE